MPLGDAAVTVEFGDQISPELHRQVRAFMAAAEAAAPPGLLEIVPTYRSVTIQFDPLHPEADSLERQLREAEGRAANLDLPPGRLHVVPVRYGGEDGPDLDELAKAHGLSPAQVIELHSDREYLVYCVGFSPGFAFLGGLPEKLHTPRLESPRKLVSAGSVGIGGQQTGVYPIATPGGWRLIGRTNFTFFDLTADPPCPISIGDRMSFQAVDELPRGENARMTVPAEPSVEPALEVTKPGLFTTVQDLGRWGYQSAGVSVAGAMDPLALRLANALVGNEPGAAGLEITLTGPTLRACKSCVVALAGASADVRLNGRSIYSSQPVELAAGDELAIGRITRGARAYLAADGGINVPLALGSRSTYTRGGFGGYDGRALQAGDTLSVGESHSTRSTRQPSQVPLPDADDVTLRVVLGPQQDHFAPDSVERFLHEAFQISPDADRMGYRLAGTPLAHTGPAEIPSDGIVLGSVQVPAQGYPIVMLADRASVGGYPKIATVITADVRLLAQCKPGMRVRFQEVTPEEGRLAARELEQRYFGQPAPADGLPLAEVKELLATMQAQGLAAAAIESPELCLHLTRRSAS